ncbi:MAG: respiratory nitrate reductase subunit gamma, partial [Silicimonas sp.]
WNINAWVTVVDVHWLYKLHIFLGLIITMLFPFTRLVHIWSGLAAPFRYLLTRPGYQIVRSRRRRPLEERRRAYDTRQAKRGTSASTPAE